MEKIKNYKEGYKDFVDDDLSKELLKNDANLDKKYGKEFVKDQVLSKISSKALLSYVYDEYGDDFLDYYSDNDLLDNVCDGSIRNYVERHCYRREFANMFENCLDEGIISVEDNDIDGLLIDIARSQTRSYLDKETMKKVINEYIDNKFIRLV